MADYVATIDAIRERIESTATLPCYWPNGEAEPSLSAAPDGFVYTTCGLSDESQISLGLEGQRTHRDYGSAMVYVHVPRGRRASAAEVEAERIRAAFGTTALDTDGIIVTRRTISEGRDVNGPERTYCVAVQIEWFSDRSE